MLVPSARLGGAAPLGPSRPPGRLSVEVRMIRRLLQPSTNSHARPAHHNAAAKTAAIATRHAYRRAHTHHRRARGVVSLSSPSTMARLIRQPTNTLVVQAPSGRSTLAGTKSRTSKNVLFSSV